MKRFLLPLLLFVVATLPATAQDDDLFSDTSLVVLQGAPPPAPPPGLLDEIRARDTLRVGISTFEPWAMYNRDGELVGYEVDVAERLAEDLGVRLQIVPNSPASMISDLLHGDYDVIVSGMNITPQRALQVDFAHAYGYSDVRIVANRRSAGQRSSVGDFNDAGLTLGVRNNSSAQALVSSYMADAQVRGFEDDLVMLDALKSGEVDAVVTYSPIAEFSVQDAPGVLVLPEGGVLASYPEGMAIRKGNQSFLNYLNAWTTYYENDPWMKGRRAYWFQTSEWVDSVVPTEADE